MRGREERKMTDYALRLTRRSALIGPIAALASAPLFAKAGRIPPLMFGSNRLADYLHVLLYRLPHDQFPPFAPPGFDKVPTLNALVAVPEVVASAGLKNYSEVRPFVAKAFAALPMKRVMLPVPRILSYSSHPPSLPEVLRVIEAGVRYFPAFSAYWDEHVRSVVQNQIAAWQDQDLRLHPLAVLIAFQRLPLRASHLRVFAMPFHPSGSGNYSPPAIFSSLFDKPNLPWFLGHEASHLIWSEALGTPITAQPGGQAALALAERRNVDLEETMCLCMQVKTSIACGLSKPERRISDDFPAGPEKQLLVAMEADWPVYLANRDRWPNLQRYVIDKAIQALAV
jgi:hypothetical protein